MKNISQYFIDVKKELGAVVWPKWQEVVKLTLMVIIISLLIGLYLGGLDLGFTKILEILVK